jgi:diaminohydroxyphosphoribosylaminopyrimidine deaminase/5-amino-6-(5-phosphoribosylamino)uracil reductase
MNDELYIRRCFELAQLGEGFVSPNPMVGAVLVHEGEILGEGWHPKFGAAHAEVLCIRSVSPQNQALIPESTLYCNLEPCAHFGKTPPCADLIVAKKIRRVVVSNTDPNPLVAGKGLAKLRAAGVDVQAGVLEVEGRWLNRAFFTWIEQNRPFIVLKWAQTSDGFLGKKNLRTAISGPQALRLVHRWRAACDAILVGTNTALTDNPRLDLRYHFGKNPLRIAFDRHGKIPASHHLLDGSAETWIFGSSSKKPAQNLHFFPATQEDLIPELLEQLKQHNRAVLFVEGGAKLLQRFLDTELWDEIRILENSRSLGTGILAPGIPEDAVLKSHFQIGEDSVRIFARQL